VFLLFWIPDFLQRTHGLKLMQIGIPIMVIYLLADVGSVAGGWLSSAMIQRGKSVNGRPQDNLAFMRHQRSANYLRLSHAKLMGRGASDWLGSGRAPGILGEHLHLDFRRFPRRSGGFVVGIGVWRGQSAACFMAKNRGLCSAMDRKLYDSLSYRGFAYLAAVAVIHSLSPKLEPVKLHISCLKNIKNITSLQWLQAISQLAIDILVCKGYLRR
jgi:ACS family hexuronate transporter-like MFS transporter